MSIIHAHIRIAPDGTIAGSAPGATPGEHEAAIILQRPARSPAAQDEALAAIRDIQEAAARLPVLDERPADEIIGYDESGLFG
jgi:hypothetical protein